MHWECSGGRYRVNKNGKRTTRGDQINAARSRIRARGEHVVRVVKCSRGFTNVRYRGLLRNTTRVMAIFALANLYHVRHRLAPHGT